ncbi:hypothetical protein DNJ95_06440 [Stutzerimonas kirkiae]|uniref:Uncharacterized protein n=1 Tax=Stutzerimonas kirkiae TaxID=2211392 RepID=A0A4Q9RCH9_9GAMM|nr:hypothetical protein DNJ96_04030 [Stutzerimonas kirkiae]TBV03983.1 hypothetical protein DNJ95_06440 [Stutzerimonas kirkiae]
MLIHINSIKEELNDLHRDLVAHAKVEVNNFWDEARASKKVMARGVAISEKGNYVNIYWLKIVYRRHADGPQEKPFLIRLPKGRTFRFSRKSMGRMDAFTESLFIRYEDKFEILRELISKNKKIYLDLSRMESLLERKR